VATFRAKPRKSTNMKILIAFIIVSFTSFCIELISG
jgi:hypothetical protein